MDEDMRPTSIFQKRIEAISEEISEVTEFMGSLESVTSEVVSAKEQWKSLTEATKEFKVAVTENEEKKSVDEGENTTESQAKGDMVVKPPTNTEEEP